MNKRFIWQYLSQGKYSLNVSKGNKRRMLMNNERRLMVKILNLTSGIDPDILKCLLLIRYIAASDEARCSSKAIKCNNGEAMWNMIVQEAHKTDGHILSAIRFAIDQIQSDLLFAEKMAKRLCMVAVDEYALKDIIHLLSNMPADYVCRHIFDSVDYQPGLRKNTPPHP